jgi:hypothetical protein
MTIYELLKQAILEKEQVIAMYDNYVGELCLMLCGPRTA